jgi:hypothetical protein
MSGGDARKIGPARGRRKRQRKPDKIMVWISDHGLINITDLYVDLPVRCRKGT